MERFDITDEKESKPNSSINRIIEGAQGIAISSSDSTVPTTSNGILKENQTKLIGANLYWQRNGVCIKFAGAESA